MNLRSLTRRCLASVFGLAVVGLAAQAQADTITPTFVSVTGTGPFTWTYSFEQSSNAQLAAGVSKVTIYDFRGWDGSHTEPNSSWTFSATTVGPVYTTPSSTDDPSFWNLTWTWNGPLTPAGGSAQDLGDFTAGSTVQFITFSDWASQDLSMNNFTQTAQGLVETPIPEPSAVLAMGLGLVAMAVRRRNR